VRSTATTVNPAPASSVAVALPSSPAPTTTATLSPAPPNEAMTISSLRPITGRPDTFRSVLRITAGQVRDRHRIPVILGRGGPHYLSASPMSSALN